MKFLTEPAYSVPLGKRVRLFEWGESKEIWVAKETDMGGWISMRKATDEDKRALGYLDPRPEDVF